jgi:hypothetical protein
MIKKIGKLNLDFNKLISYFDSIKYGSNTTFVSPLHVSIQKEKFAEKGYTDQQIKRWEDYIQESTMMGYVSDNELIKKYIEARIDSSILAEQQLNREIVKWNIQKQVPGRFTVPHYDLYHSVTTHSPDQIVRLWIPLEDAKFGHALFVGDTVLSDFKAGEIYDWELEDLHAAVNSGFDPRYTLLLYLSKQTA